MESPIKRSPTERWIDIASYTPPAIDLIDGDLLMDRLKELGLSVKTEKVEVEQITVDRNWILSR